MECPSCLEIYDEYQRIPRNLPCGHTYCESCLEQLLFVKKKFECPICCTKLDPLSKPTSFSKNFVAAEISTKHRELQKKLLFCLTHEEPLRFFCQTCQVNICSSCILEHNGHFFAKQDHSGKSVNLAFVKCIASLLIQRAKEIKTKIGIKLEDLGNQITQQKKSLDDLKQARDQNLKEIDSEFDVLLSQLLKRKATLKEDYHKTSEEKLAVIDSEVVKVHDFVESLTKKKEDISDYFTQLDKVKIVQGDLLEKELNKLEEVVNVELQNIKKNTPEFSPFLSNVIFDSSVYKELQKFGMMAQDVHNPRICYFGEKNKILIYDINSDEWDMTQLSFGETYEFNYYSSAVTLPNGSIILTGGESSNAVCQVYLTSYRAHKHPSVKIVQREPMNQPRKEHVSLYLSNNVYVLGGYNGKSNNFLNLCERYDLETGHWHAISSMIVPKCAFAATTLNNRYIFAVGGYNGTIRLNSIEKYDIKTDKWTMLDVKMKQSLSNSACFAYSEQSIMILGGGHNKGFSLEMSEFNTETQKWKKFKSMSDGKDLRNKVIVFNGEIFAIGGNNGLAEKFSLRKNDWELLSSYQSFVNDNLDSWACALYYDMTKNVEEEAKPASSLNLGLKFTNPYANNYQLYGYDNMYEHEDPFSGQSSLSDDEENFD